MPGLAPTVEDNKREYCRAHGGLRPCLSMMMMVCVGPKWEAQTRTHDYIGMLCLIALFSSSHFSLYGKRHSSSNSFAFLFHYFLEKIYFYYFICKVNAHYYVICSLFYSVHCLYVFMLYYIWILCMKM